MKKEPKKSFLSFLNLFALMAMLVFITACGGSQGGTTPEPGDTPSTLDIVVSPPTVKSDNTTTATITLTAKDASNAAMAGITITLSADTGNLSASSLVTGGDGTATATFSSGGPPTGPINRTATITAIAGIITSQAQVEIIGSTVTMTSTGTSLNNDGSNTITLTITAKNAGGNGVNGAAVTLTQSSSDGGSVNFGATSGTTATVNSVVGVFKTTVTGASAGTVTIIARALNASATITVTVSTVTEAFAIDQQTLCVYPGPVCTIVPGNPNPTSMQIGDELQIRVNIPAAYAGSNVNFASSTGYWNGVPGDFTVEVTPAGGKATATLYTASVGNPTVDVSLVDDPDIKDTLVVGMSSGAPAYRIILQATPTVVPRVTGTATITATVRDALDVAVANVPVAFTILNPTGGGETIDPVVQVTGTDGRASTDFQAGTLPSYDAGGVMIRARVLGTSAPVVETGLAPSGNDASITIGGVPGSMAFGLATELVETGGSPPTQYRQSMSVLVTDISGNPVPGVVVSLSLWPIAWSTGWGCSFDPDGLRYNIITDTYDPCDACGTFLNEDVNENIILDNYSNPYDPLVPSPAPYDEDGLRQYYYTPGTYAPIEGTPDDSITPPNAAASVAPSSSTTDASGIATFNVTYPKDSAIWTVVRVKATAIVQGSETVGQKIFRLSALQKDVSPCRLDCPYEF